MLGLGTQFSPLAASPGLLLLATVPHGIIELPALWIGAAWGMKLGLAWLLPRRGGRRLRVLGHSALETGQVFVLVSLMLLAAAAIEANVTLALVQQQAPAVRAADPWYTLKSLRRAGRSIYRRLDLEGMRCPRARPTSSGSRSKRSGASAIARCALP